MVECTQAELRSIARRFRTSSSVVQRMAQADVLDKDQALNGNDATPEGLITLGDAARKYNFSIRTLQGRVRRGRLAIRGTRPGPGHVHYLVSEADILASIANPPKPTGRPCKSVF